MKKIRLYGVLAQKFGREFEMDVASPAEAVRALCAVVPGFRQHLVDHSEPGYVVKAGHEARGAEELHCPLGDTEVIRIAPAVAGSSAMGRIVVGVILVVIAIYAPYLLPTALQTSAGIAAVAMFGVSMVVGGVSELLMPRPKFETDERPENKPSYAFSGPVNTIGQGNPVPIGYGELIIGSQLISAQMYSEELA